MKYSESEMECESCKELNEVCERLEVDLIYGNDSGYFHAMSDMVINYCPVCGRKLKIVKDTER